MSILKTSNAAMAAFCLMTASASAMTVLFKDDFQRPNSNTIGNGWSELQDENNDVAVRFGNLRLRDNIGGLPDAAAASQTIDATGYENIKVSFRWRSLVFNEASDDLFLSFAEAPAPELTRQNAWTQMFRGGDGGVSTFSETVSLDGAEDSLFNIMFWTNVSSAFEGFLIREVTVTGDAIAPVPLPAALPLLLAGLGALGVARRRKTQS